jgi:YcaO-like protein with predicted kinase domain
MNELGLKLYRDGTHRAVPPRVTLSRVLPLLSRFGITRVANLTGLDAIGIPVVTAVRPNSRCLAVSQGKGWDLDAARASAIMEAVESFHAERVLLPLKLAGYNELQDSGHRVVEIGLPPLVPAGRFHGDQPLLWIEGEDLLRSEKIWVPYQLVHTAYTSRMRFDLSSFAASSVGLASGNHPLEALSHAICEVVENDADWRFSRLSEKERRASQIDLATVDHLQCRELLERCAAAGVAVAVWDITSRIGLAAFRCHIAESEDDPVRRLAPGGGLGCHPVRHIAFLRALTEAVQSRLTAIAGSRDDMLRWRYQSWRDPANLAEQRRLARAPGSRAFCAVPSHEADSFQDDVERELDLLRGAGYGRAIMVDLTRPEFGIPVVRVLIPGMEQESG